MVEILLLLLILLAVVALQTRNMIGAVVLLAVFSLLSCLVFYLLHAPDVALTEAAVGSGVGTVILIWIVSKTESRDTT
jgi:uncharacterized MnhB-related membrane protein